MSAAAVSEVTPTPRSSTLEPYGQLIRMLMPRAQSIAIYDRMGVPAWMSDGRDVPELRRLLQEALSAEMRSSLRNYDKQGFVYSFGDWNPDIFAVGVPLISADRTRVMALSCSGAMFDITRKRIVTELGPRMVVLRERIFTATRGVF